MTVAALQRTPLASLWLRPWYDQVMTGTLGRWYFPLSRAWAAAAVSNSDPGRFAALVPCHVAHSARLRRVLALVSRRVANHAATEARWRDLFFGSQPPHHHQLGAMERTRLRQAHAFMTARSLFLPWQLGRAFPAVRWNVAPPEVVHERHGPRLRSEAFPPPSPTVIGRSHAVQRLDEEIFWLRFAATGETGGDTAWARVDMPHGPCRGALIFAHGIGIETEYWRGMADPHDALLSAGIALIRPEGPFHGRRRPPGDYGGERVLGTGIIGMLDYIAAHVGELAQLIQWARDEFSAPVAVGGVSLGSLTAQMAVVAAADWPAAMRPDAAFLVTTSASMLAAGVDGELPKTLGIPAALRRAGWTAAAREAFLPLAEPRDRPSLPGARVIMLLGRADTITPFASGHSLAKAWELPSENLFIRPQGHFTASMGLARDDTPLRQLAKILKAL